MRSRIAALVVAIFVVSVGARVAGALMRWELSGWDRSIAVRANDYGNGACKAAGVPFACCTGNGTGTCGYPTCQHLVTDSRAGKSRFVYVTAEFSLPSTETVNASQTFTLVPLRSNSTSAPTSVYDDNIATANACWYPSATYRGQEVDENIATYISDVKATMPAGATSTFILMTRSDIITWPTAQVAGLQCSWFADTTTPWTTFQSALAADTSMGSGGLWSDSYSGHSASFRDKDIDCRNGTAGNQDCRLRASIDRICGAADSYKNKTFYFTRGTGTNYLYPDAAVMRLDNSDYRAWWIDSIKRRLAATGADMIEHNQKFTQYFIDWNCTSTNTPYPCCSGNKLGPCSSYLYDMYSTLSAWGSGPTSNFSGNVLASPTSYNYLTYVTAWRDLATELKVAGVRFSVNIGPHAWFATGTGLDDVNTTGTDENSIIRAGAYSAAVVLLDTANVTQSQVDTAVSDLNAHGVPVYKYRSDLPQYPRGD